MRDTGRRTRAPAPSAGRVRIAPHRAGAGHGERKPPAPSTARTPGNAGEGAGRGASVGRRREGMDHG